MKLAVSELGGRKLKYCHSSASAVAPEMSGLDGWRSWTGSPSLKPMPVTKALKKPFCSSWKFVGSAIFVSLLVDRWFEAYVWIDTL
jgi:hypothetical protein